MEFRTRRSATRSRCRADRLRSNRRRRGALASRAAALARGVFGTVSAQILADEACPRHAIVVATFAACDSDRAARRTLAAILTAEHVLAEVRSAASHSSTSACAVNRRLERRAESTSPHPIAMTPPTAVQPSAHANSSGQPTKQFIASGQPAQRRSCGSVTTATCSARRTNDGKPAVETWQSLRAGWSGRSPQTAVSCRAGL